jgi:hypothetical protein
MSFTNWDRSVRVGDIARGVALDASRLDGPELYLTDRGDA